LQSENQITENAMAKLVNPIYGTVFKYIMQDEKVAKVLIGNILKTRVETVQMNNNEYSALLPTGQKVFKLDFTATILDSKNHSQLVHIEVQKALEDGEIMRFREYLGAIYMDATKCMKEKVRTYSNKEKIVEHPLPIHSIYILGHELGDGLKYSVMHGDNVFHDDEGNVINIPDSNDYINGLTHRVTFVIAPLTKKNVKTHLDKLLTIFSECDPKNPQHMIDIDEFYDDSDDYRILMKALEKASADKQLRGNLSLEQHAWRNYMNLELENKDLKGMVSEQKKQMQEQQRQMDEQQRQMDEQQRQMDEQQRQMQEQQRQMDAKDSQLRNIVKTLSLMGKSISEIADLMAVDEDTVKRYLD